jgi:hypothetical protein
MPLIREAPTLSTRLYRLVKEILEELLLMWMKFKAWLTPGTADDEVSNNHYYSVVQRSLYIIVACALSAWFDCSVRVSCSSCSEQVCQSRSHQVIEKGTKWSCELSSINLQLAVV